MTRISKIFVLTTVFTLQARALVDISSQDLSWTQEKPWKALLHYRPHWGSEKSTVDHGDFFFAKNGASDPQAEAIAFAQALQENRVVGKLKQTVFCGFPERTRFLIEKTKLILPPEVTQQKCELYEKFVGQFHDPEKVSLVFSSAYPNNPASMFGHTFLKIHSKRQTDLLDVGINYAAVVSEDENPFAFFWFGVTGGYDGRWSIEPYYVKVQDYVNFESRDLWEYEINFTPAQVRRLIDHIWEVEVNSESDYFFFDENCSYQILSTIEAIEPRWNLLNYHIYVIPGESVKFLARAPDSIRLVRYRPSLYKKALLQYNLISDEEKKSYNEVLNQKALPDLKKLSVTSLDTLLIEMDFKRNQDKKNFPKVWGDFEKALRIERAGRGIATTLSSFDETGSEGPVTRPDLGHDSYDLQTGLGYKHAKNKDSGLQDERSYASFKIKSAYNDLLNADMGFSPFSEIDFPWVQFSVDSHGKWQMDELGGLQTISLSPVSHFKTPISFKARIAIENQDLLEEKFHYLEGELGFGLSSSLSGANQRLYGLVTLESQVAREFEKGYRALPGFEMGYLIDGAEKYKLQLLTKWQCNLVAENECRVESDLGLNESIFLSRNQEIRNTNLYRQYFFDHKIEEMNFSLSYLYFFN